MLILSRREDEGITIVVPPSDTPTTILVVLSEIRGDKARLGFDAPRDCEILRDDAIVRERKEDETPAV